MEFENHFRKIYGPDWPALHEALLKEESQILFSPFQRPLENYLRHPEEFAFKNKEDSFKRDSEDSHLQNYVLDPASLVPVLNLDLKPEDHVLDLCAAPGGKSLGILAGLGKGGFLLSNDSSKPRFERLRKVLSQYVPEKSAAQRQVTNKDGTKFGFYFKERFHKILVDAPCSAERHLLSQSKIGEWKEKRAKFLSVKQYTLLCAALLCACPGARIVYSTCSINPVENDEVIRRFLKKKGDHVRNLKPSVDFEGAVSTEYGTLILPHQRGFGPIYCSVLEVLSERF